MELDFEQLCGYLEQTTTTKVFPFIIRNGYQNVSERGFEEKGTPSYFFSFFQKVFTGTETITATWEDSTELNVRDESLGTYNYDFKVGKYFEGVVVPSSEMNTTEITNVSGNDSFLAMQTNGDVNVLFFRNAENEKDTDFKFDEDYLYKLYIMPETKFGNKWLYISNISTHQSPNNPNLIIEVVTFSSLKDKLETSGRAIEQYVQYAAPGEPYAFPYITYDKEVIVSPLRTNPEQIKYLQVELQGASALSSITVFGRKIYWDEENQKWYTSPSKFLLPYRFVVPQANPLAKTSSPTKNFYVFPNETIETRSTSEWLEAIKKQSTELAPIQNMGSFTMSGDWKYTPEGGQEITGVHISNKLTDGHHFDYNDRNWKPLESFTAENLPTISTNGNVYASDTVVYKTTDSLIQILIKNSMANITQLELPLDMKQTKPYRWSTFKILGFWTRWFGDRAIRQHSTNVRSNNICYLIDTNLATMQYNAFAQSGTAYGNLQMFSGENAPAGLNPQSANTTMCFELTDKVSFTDAKYNDNPEHSRPLANGIDTVYFSQITDEYGVNLHDDGTALLLNCADNSIDTKYVDYGFVIDNVVVNALHIGKIKVSCYGTEGQSLYGATYSPQFTQTVLSNSMFESNNIRNWTTNLTLGTWDENWSSGDITWPLEPQKKLYNSIPLNAQGTDYDFGSTFTGSPVIPTGFSKDDGNTNISRSESIYNQTIAYDQIDGDIHTKAEFFNKYGKLAFDITGTKMKLMCGDDYGPDFEWEEQCNGNQYIIFNLDPTQSSITSSNSIFATNNTEYNPIFPHNYPGDYLLLQRFKNSLPVRRENCNSGLNNYLTFNITFGENELTLNIVNNCIIKSYGWSAETWPEYFGWTTRSGGSEVRPHRVDMKFKIKIPRLYTIEKEN